MLKNEKKESPKTASTLLELGDVVFHLGQTIAKHEMRRPANAMHAERQGCG